MPAYFYLIETCGTSTAFNEYPVTCRSCNGGGVVWEPCGCQQGETIMAGGVKVIYHTCQHEDKPS